ncbi:MAG: MTAP family purine nucleoside phosphorylase [Caldisericia bacterium]|nr:MTAP family purine nucleoside phosphorylase [Caldisericia bacterium]
MILGLIGGSGFLSFPFDNKPSEEIVDTKYGKANLQKCKFKNTSLYFLPRHGRYHSIPPHSINYRANIKALELVGVTHIISTGAVGAINSDFKPGMLGTCSSYLEFTHNRQVTFFDSFEKGMVHTDQTNPYSKFLNDKIIGGCTSLNLPNLTDLTMVVTQGPRYETTSEIKMFKLLGGDIVGMTGYPEVALANELKIEYSCIAISTNYAAGLSSKPLTIEEVENQMNLSQTNLNNLFKNIFKSIWQENG